MNCVWYKECGSIDLCFYECISLSRTTVISEYVDIWISRFFNKTIEHINSCPLYLKLSYKDGTVKELSLI
jgi:hypothetical protein